MSSWYKKITEFLCDWASWYLGQVNGGSWEGMVQPLIILWWTLVNFYKQLSEILWMKYKHILFFNFCIFRDKFLQFNFEIEMFPLFLQYIAILFHPKKLKVFLKAIMLQDIYPDWSISYLCSKQELKGFFTPESISVFLFIS